MSDDEIEKHSKSQAVKEVITGKYLKQFLVIKKVATEGDEAIKLLICIKRLMPF